MINHKRGDFTIVESPLSFTGYDTKGGLTTSLPYSNFVMKK